MSEPDRVWERRQAARPDTWALDFDGAVRGSFTLSFGAAAASFTAELSDPLVVVREDDIALPRSLASWGVRAEGLWADMNCETPFEHWSYGLEAFGLALDDRTDERGDPIALGFDLEWEATGPVEGGEGSYSRPGIVHGEILVGTSAIAFDGRGVRRHHWGSLRK